MATHADKEPKSQPSPAVNSRGGSDAALHFVDNRAEATAQRRRQDKVDDSAQVKQQATTNRILQWRQAVPLAGPAFGKSMIAQLVSKRGPAGTDIEVTEIPDGYVPGCLDSVDGVVKFYRRSDGITEGWNDTDLFYTVDEGNLVQLTTETVNTHWDQKYPNFAKASGPDWTRNCEEYATGGGEPGTKLGDYTNAEQLDALLGGNGSYVLHLSYHWMKVEKTGADAFTIRQKDGESAVYTKNFNKADVLEYILGIRSAGGAVHRG
ncbi:MAG TPA: hypothetical protein VIF60_21480 [Burkholderiaceae bacterium]|jgi:hypothetical protein